MNVEKIKEAIAELVSILKEMIKNMSDFIEGWKQKDGFDE